MKRCIYILCAGICIIGFSCSKLLNREPQSQLTQEETFSSLDKISATLDGLITSWRNLRKDRGGFMFMLGNDESQQGAYQVMSDPDQAALDKYGSFLNASNNAITGQWQSRSTIIPIAAQIIYALQNFKDTSDPATIKALLGEACMIRAGLEFEITQYWGEVPVMDWAKKDEYGAARQPLDLVYGQITSDLTIASQDLPETQSDHRRFSRYAAIALLGKVYLYAPDSSGFRDYQKAADNFEQVINSGHYALLPDYADVFDPNKQNSSESIYEFQFNNVSPDNNVDQWQMGSRVLANLFPNCYFGGYDFMVPTKYCYSDKSAGGLWETGDARKDISIRYDFTYHGVAPTLPAGLGGDELDPHVKKYEDIRTDSVLSFYQSGKDVYYLRYADILLNYAECLNELGKTSDAVDIVNNQVRKRAWGGSLPDSLKWSTGMSQDQFRTNMLDERMRELCFEGWRRMDLIRTGQFVNLIKARNKWANQTGAIQPFNQLYPIPFIEMAQNPDIPQSAQNPGYNN